MAVDLLALKTEITTDPEAKGYAGKSVKEQAALINAAGSSTADIDRIFVSAAELQNQVVGTEFETLTATQQRLWLVIITAALADDLDLRGSNLRGQVTSAWPAGVTRNNLAALQKIPQAIATRAEQLWGHKAVIAHEQISVALSL